jgi:uncharacterized membrane protein YeaQ/YmgE (transglycosylase-associated protein family)
MLGAVLLGLVAGVIARMLTPGDVFGFFMRRRGATRT